MLTRKGYFGMFLNVVLVTCGSVLLILGSYMAYFYFSFKQFVEPIVWIYPTIIAAIGFFTMLTSIFGFCGGTFACRTLFFIFVFLIIGSSIALGSFWVNAKDNSPRLIEDVLLRAFTYYDGSLDQKFMWQQLHKKLDCCGVNGPMDFNRSKGQIPSDCYKSPPKRIFLNYYSQKTTPEPLELVEAGCREPLSNRLILDRYIIGSASLVAGLLVLLTLITSLFIVFEEEEECEPEMYNGIDLDNYCEYFQVPPSSHSSYNCIRRAPVECNNQLQQTQMFTQPYQDSHFPTQHIPTEASQDSPVPLLIIPISQQAPGQINQPIGNLQPFRPFIPSPSINPPFPIESIQPYRPVQLQMPDMSFFSSLMPSGRRRRRHRRRSRYGRRRYNSEPPISIIPMPTGSGFIVCNNERDDDSDDENSD